MFSITFPRAIGHGINENNSKKDVGHNNNADKESPPAKPGADTGTVVASATEGSDIATATASTHAYTDRTFITAGKRTRSNVTHPEVAKRVHFEDKDGNDDQNACIASPDKRTAVRRTNLMGPSTIFSLPLPIAKQASQEGQTKKPGALPQQRK